MSEPTIIATGSPDWLEQARTIAGRQGFVLEQITEQDGYVAQLTDFHAALILVDGADPDWRYWCTTPKASPATRRIPVVLLSDDGATVQEARTSGADVTFAPDMLGTELEIVLRKHARVQDSATRDVLMHQCRLPLPPRCIEALEMFNAGEFYKQHDLFEAQWMEEEGPVRDLYRAILQVGVAYYQVQRGNKRGAQKMLLRSVQWLNLLPDFCQGVNIGALRRDAMRVREALEALPDDADLDQDFDHLLLKPVKWIRI